MSARLSVRPSPSKADLSARRKAQSWIVMMMTIIIRTTTPTTTTAFW